MRTRTGIRLGLLTWAFALCFFCSLAFLISEVWRVYQAQVSEQTAMADSIQFERAKDRVMVTAAKLEPLTDLVVAGHHFESAKAVLGTLMSLRIAVNRLDGLYPGPQADRLRGDVDELWATDLGAVAAAKRGGQRGSFHSPQQVHARVDLYEALRQIGNYSRKLVSDSEEDLASASAAAIESAGAALIAMALAVIVFARSSARWRKTITATSQDRNRAETELQGSRARFENFVANLPGMAYQLVRSSDGEFSFTYVSDGCREMFGVEAQDAIADPRAIFGKVHADDIDELRTRMADCAAKMESNWWTGRVNHPSGLLRLANYASHPQVNEHGELTWDGLLLDDTPRYRAEQELVHSKNFLDSVVEHLPDMVFIKEAESLRFVLLNKAGEEMIGFRREELIGKNDYDFFPADQADEFVARDRLVLADRELTEIYREPIDTKDRGRRILHTKKIPILDADGVPRFLLGISDDVTDRIKTEQALVESEQRLKAILDHASAPILLHDLEGRVLLANERALRLYSTSATEMLGRMPEQFLEEISAKTYRLAEAEVVLTRRAVEIEEIVSGEDGNRTFITTRFPLIDTEGNVFAVGSIGTDITERKRTGDEIKAAKEDAERANLAKNMFLSRMSHELRTPLNAILGFAQLLELEPLPADQLETVTFILNAGHHLLRLINEVLDISRIESGNLSMSVEAVSVYEIAHEVVAMANPMAGARQIAITLSNVKGGDCIRADRQRVAQSLLNLVSNAIKYNRQKGTVDIVWANLGNGRGKFEVRDSGPGINPLALDRLFVPFDRLGAEGTSTEGTGLGLSLSKRLVEAMGGTLDLESTSTNGSVFYIELPAALPDELLRPMRGTDEQACA